MFKRQEIKYYGQNQQITSSSLHKTINNKQSLSKSLNKDRKGQLIPHSADHKEYFEYSSTKNKPHSVQKPKLRIKSRSPQVPQLKSNKKVQTNTKNTRFAKIHNKSIAQNTKQYSLRIKAQQKLTEINLKSRIILIDWLIQVTLELGLSKQALYQAISYLDKLAQKMYISKSQYQCVGLSCLILSHKIDSHKPLSFTIASNLVQGCQNQAWFKENEQKMLKELQFRLNPFTIWQQIKMILVGFQIFLKNQIASIPNWDLIKNKILWVTEGIIMGKIFNYRDTPQKDLCICIICLVAQQLVSHQYISEKRLNLFCKSLLTTQSYQQITNIQIRINFWRTAVCSCASPYSPQIYHPQLKLFASQA